MATNLAINETLLETAYKISGYHSKKNSEYSLKGVYPKTAIGRTDTNVRSSRI